MVLGEWHHLEKVCCRQNMLYGNIIVWGSTCAILSRSFCNVNQINHIGVISSTFVNGVREIRDFEKECEQYSNYFRINEEEIAKRVKIITDSIDV